MPIPMQPSEVFMLLGLALVQAGLVFTIRRRLGSRLTGNRVILFWLAVALYGVVGLSGLVLSLVRQFAPVFRPIRTVALLWLIPSTPALVAYLIYRYFETKMERNLADPGRRRLLQAAGAAAVAAPFAVEAWGAFITRIDFRVQEIDLPIAGLHPDLAGLRILQISDVHLSPYLSERQFARVIDAANELRPQVAVMTGDLISSWGDPIDACLEQLSRIKADAPLLGSLGNHEIYAEVERYTELQAARRGMEFLRHRRRELKFGAGVLNIAGVDYQPFRSRGRYLKGAEPLVVPHATNILLSHNPDVFSEAPEQGWQAMLAGHTHGGQVTVEILKQTANVARFFTRYVSGLYVERGSACYVTRGIGTVGIPVRVGAKPEITLLRLRKT